MNDKSMYCHTELTSQDKAGIKGEYLGLTHTSGNRYYSLLGERQDLSTTEGKLYRKVDEAIIKNYGPRPTKDLYDVEWEYEASTDFSGILPFNRNSYTGANNNVHPYENSYFGSTMYFIVYENSMSGRFENTDLEFKRNNHMGMVKLKPGYIAYVRVAGSMDNSIIQLVFSAQGQAKRLVESINRLELNIKR